MDQQQNKLVDELIDRLEGRYKHIYRRGYPEYTCIVHIKYYEPYDEERFQHYKALIEKLNELCFVNVFEMCYGNSIRRGRKRLEKKQSHDEIVKREWYDEIVAVLKKYGQKVKDYATIEDTDGWMKHRNPILYDYDKTVIDKEAVYTDDSTIIELNIPVMFDNELFLTDERIEWLVEELMF